MKLSVNNVSFAYRSSDVLKNISFESDGGEVLGILGKNGCGKTTLMKCVNGHLRPHSGTILINETPVSKMSRKDIAKKMAIVAQSASISFAFTVLDVVMMGLYPSSELFENPTDEDMKKVLDAMTATDMVDFAHRPITELSGGERQRALISRALVQDPEILLLDEPTLHLDINHQFSLMELIRKLAREKEILVMIVTHDISLAARYCDRVLLIDKGNIVAIGRVEDVITEKNIEQVFFVRSVVKYDEVINGLSVTLLGRPQD